MMVSIEEIRRFNTDTGSIEDLVALSAFGGAVLAEFESLDVQVPEWLEPKVRAIRREVQHKQHDLLEQKLANAKLQLKGLMSQSERKTELLTEVQRLEKALGGGKKGNK